MPQQSDVTIPTPLTSGALDNPNAPQRSASEQPSKVIGGNNVDLFPLLSKSPGFIEAMVKADNSGSYDPETTLPPAMIMQRNLKVMEGSDLYKKATAQDRIKYQAAFYKRYVIPAQRAAKYKGSFREWLQDRGTYWQGQVDPKSQDKPLGGLVPGVNKESKEKLDAFASGLAKTGLTIAQQAEEARRYTVQKFQNISKEFSLGTAMLNAEIAPHMGPIIMNPHYKEVRQSGTAKEINQLLKDDEWFGVHGYKQTTANKLMRGGGELAGDLPLFFATDGIMGLTVEGITDTTKAAQVASRLPMSGLKQVGAKAIGNAAQGYLIGAAEGKDPNKEAAAFGIGGGLLHLAGWQVTEGLISPAAKYLGKIFGYGGGKLLNELATHGEANVLAKAPEATSSSVATSLAGSQKQKINAALVMSLNDLTGGNFSKAPTEAKKEALAKLAVAAPEFAQQIAFIEKNIIGIEAAKNLVAQRAAVPEFNDVLTKLEKASGQATHETVADAAHKETSAQMMRRSSDKWVQEVFKDEITKRLINEDIAKRTGIQRRSTDVVPGAASTKSLEFGENLSKHIDDKLAKIGLGKDKLQFETRKDKLLFFLNILTAENRIPGLGPTKERQQVFHALLNKLQEEFPGEQGRLPNLLAASDKVWTDIENLTKAGKVNEAGVLRYWRQHSRPGESPFAHEVQLLQEAAKADSDAELRSKTVSQVSPEEEDKKLAKAQTEQLKTAVTKTSSTHTTDLQQAAKKLFPNKKFEDLTSAEREQAVNVSLGKPAVPDKGMSSQVREAGGQLKPFAEAALRRLGYETNQIVRFKDAEVEDIIRNAKKPPKKGPELRMEGHGTE